MHDRIRVVDVAGFIRVRAAHEDEILIVLHETVKHLTAILQTLTEERLLIVTGSRYADHKLVAVRLHCLLEKVVLLRLLVGVHFVCNTDIAVQ